MANHIGILGALLFVALVALGGQGLPQVQAANGDNLRTITADRTGTDCVTTGSGFGGDYPGAHSSVGVGIAFDGTNLLISCYSDNTVTEIDPADGSQVAVHVIAGASSLGALAWDNGRGVVWACSGFATIGTISLVTNVFTPIFDPVGGCFDGLAYDGADDTLWSGYDANDRIDHSTTAGVHIATFTSGITRSGIAVGGSLLYMANDGGQQIYQSPKDLSAVTLLASFPARLEDLECDNITFAPASGAIWSTDAYDNILNAWEIPAGACAFGGGNGPTVATVATTIHLPDHTPLPCIPVSSPCHRQVAPGGSVIHDETTVTSSDATKTPTGTIDLRFFGSTDDCNGGKRILEEIMTLGGTGGVTTAESKSTKPLAAGEYSYRVKYQPDAAAKALGFLASASPCERLTVLPKPK